MQHQNEQTMVFQDQVAQATGDVEHVEATNSAVVAWFDGSRRGSIKAVSTKYEDEESDNESVMSFEQCTSSRAKDYPSEAIPIEEEDLLDEQEKETQNPCVSDNLRAIVDNQALEDSARVIRGDFDDIGGDHAPSITTDGNPDVSCNQWKQITSEKVEYTSSETNARNETVRPSYISPERLARSQQERESQHSTQTNLILSKYGSDFQQQSSRSDLSQPHTRGQPTSDAFFERFNGSAHELPPNPYISMKSRLNPAETIVTPDHTPMGSLVIPTDSPSSWMFSPRALLSAATKADTRNSEPSLNGESNSRKSSIESDADPVPQYAQNFAAESTNMHQVPDAEMVLMLERNQLFSKEMINHLDDVQRQAQAGVYWTKRMGKFISRVGALQDEYGKKLSKLAKDESARLARGHKPDGMASTSNYMRSLVGTCESFAEMSHIIGARFHEVHSAKFFASYNRGEDKLKVLAEHDKKHRVQLDAATAAVDKAKAKCKSLIDSAATASSVEMQSVMGATAKTGFSKFKEKFTKNSNKDDLQSKLDDELEAYSKILYKAQSLQQEYMTSVLPEVLSEYEELEKSRFEMFARASADMDSQVAKFGEKANMLVDKVRRLGKVIDPKHDIINFVTKTRQLRSETPEALAKEFYYDLPIGRKGALFRSSLAAIMHRQSKGHPHKDIPVVIDVLLEAIKNSRGFETEGIFRVSPESTTVMKLKAQIEDGDLNIQCNSPHIPAALLKEFLRGLPDPIVPESEYDLCLKLARTGSIRISDLDELAARLPSTNLSILKRLGQFVQEMLEPGVLEITKMSHHNLAVVFAPGIMRKSSLAPNDMLVNTKFEVDFTRELLLYFGTH